MVRIWMPPRPAPQATPLGSKVTIMTEAQSVPQPHSDMRARAPPRSFPWPLAVQAAAYVVLIALACLPGSGAVSSSTFSVTAFAVAAIIVLFAFFCPY